MGNGNNIPEFSADFLQKSLVKASNEIVSAITDFGSPGNLAQLGESVLTAAGKALSSLPEISSNVMAEAMQTMLPQAAKSMNSAMANLSDIAAAITGGGQSQSTDKVR